jgi:DNA repair protein RadA/Sms
VARTGSRFVCQSCGAAFPRWEGQCRTCGTWNSLVETVVREGPRTARGARAASAAPAAASEPLGAAADATLPRLPTGIGELDRVLGGGFVPGSIVLVGGEPGIGKSTLLLQAAAALGTAADAVGRCVLYATGEETAGQVRLRAERLGLLVGPAARAVRVVAEREVGRIAETARAERPVILVVDSIQTIASDELDGPAGSVGQVREAAARLQQLAKDHGVAVILVGHVTKDGSLAGPKTLEHLVDAVLAVEGERYAALRLLRASKNRFGSTEEIGVFEMGSAGLVEVADPARAFLVEHDAPSPGSVIAPTLEGTRPLLVEVQALVAPGGYGPPRRTASGIDPNRLALLIAVLGRRAGIALGSHDVYANLAGGLSVAEPGIDLPLAIALASSLRDAPVSPSMVAIGEVGLLGELRTVPGLDRRLREAARLGFAEAIVPRAGRGGGLEVAGLEVVAANDLGDAIAHALGSGGRSGPAGGERVAAGGPAMLG